MKRFELDEEQVDAILELKLYKPGASSRSCSSRRSSTRSARRPSASRRCSRATTQALGAWSTTSSHELQDEYGDKRRTKIGGVGEEPEFDAEAFIVDEDANVVLTARRLGQARARAEGPVADALREGDEVIGGARRLDQGERGRSSPTRPAYVVPHQRRRRRRPATAIRCRSCSSSTTASGWSRRCRSTARHAAEPEQPASR